jgi:polysaccharide pyruvyl transferase WcaK-like protein
MGNKLSAVCLLGAGFQANNGVGALTAGAVRCVIHANPKAKVFLLDYGRNCSATPLACSGKMIVIPVVDIRFSKRFYLSNNIARLIATSLLLKLVPPPIRKRAIGRNPWLSRIDQADAVASIAGGDSFSDIYGLPRFFYVALPQLLAIWMGKTVVLLPQTIGPFKSWLARVVSRYIMRHATLIYSRDGAGLKSAVAQLHANDATGKVRFCYDVGFVMEPVPPARLDLRGLPAGKVEGSCRVGMNVSGLLAMGGYNRRNMFGLQADYADLMRRIAVFLIEEKDAEVVLVPHVVGYGRECDSPVCDDLYAELKGRYGGRIGLISGAYNYSEIKYIIGQFDFFIGSRMHACIAAVSQCVPAVSIAYSDKFSGVMDALDAGLPVADPRRMDIAEILEIVNRAFDDRLAARHRLELQVPLVEKKVLTLFDEIADATSVA